MMPRIWWLVFAAWTFFLVVLLANLWHYGQVFI